MQPLSEDPSPRVYHSDESGVDEACTKIWTAYSTEAEKHDRALMESWTRDMKGVLIIFAALFSATLTAFIVESYQTLQVDPASEIAVLLKTISGQLANGNFSATAPGIQSRPWFAPATSSIWCNVLWFFSLFLSLTCALLATLVEQWTRGFTQRIDGPMSPVTRAKIFTYLHSGLNAFDMHTLVDLIPLLLHASAMIFFAASIVLLYLIFTVLPLIRPDSPYWTPLSGISWRILQTIETLVAGALQDQHEAFEMRDTATASMTDHMVQYALKPSGGSQDRDIRALCWTARTLTEGRGLEVLIEGIYDIIWSSKGRRFSYDHLVVGLLANRHTHLIPRIQQVFTHAASDLHLLLVGDSPVVPMQAMVHPSEG
ncbi:hypothetical protein DFH06DRAFT_1471430 [Mycena polygramma]|nr:hypothetical protein DFH06DRAFT_1471430 [Mycena polygramma]